MSLGTLLVVEDDEAIRRGLVDAVKFAGYRVLEADNGRDGLDLAVAADDIIIRQVGAGGYWVQCRGSGTIIQEPNGGAVGFAGTIVLGENRWGLNESHAGCRKFNPSRPAGRPSFRGCVELQPLVDSVNDELGIDPNVG